MSGFAANLKTAKEPEKYRLEPHFVKENFFTQLLFIYMNREKENKEGIDLSSGFKDSDSDMKFENEWQRPTQTFYPGTPKIIQWMMKYSGGLVKDEKQATYILLGFVALAIIITLFLIFGGSGDQPPKIPTSPFDSP